MRKTLMETQEAAVELHALAQGSVALMDQCQSDTTPAANALYALLHVLVERADKLADDLDVLVSAQRRPADTSPASAGVIQ